MSKGDSDTVGTPDLAEGMAVNVTILSQFSTATGRVSSQAPEMKAAILRPLGLTDGAAEFTSVC